MDGWGKEVCFRTFESQYRLLQRRRWLLIGYSKITPIFSIANPHVNAADSLGWSAAR